MKRPVLLLLALSLAVPLFAIDVDPRLDKAARGALPVCGDATLVWEELPLKMPARFTAALAKIESPSRGCAGQLAAVLSPAGNIFLGSPWLIGDEEGATIEEKLKGFTWRNMHENVAVTIERKTNDDGLWPVTMAFLTEAGSMPMYGSVDPQGRLFFFGQFRKAAGDIPAQRTAMLGKFLSASPAKGAEAAPVTIVEFSDFQCPSCRRSSGYVESILARHGEKIRYVRFDLPLQAHAWAFPAALAGRAIYRQKPEAFWAYKKAVYDNQDQLNAFVFWDWARGFAQDHDVDLARYDADLASAELKKDILDGAGLALSNDVRATPTYLVNGVLVDAGEEGKDLGAYVEKLLQ